MFCNNKQLFSLDKLKYLIFSLSSPLDITQKIMKKRFALFVLLLAVHTSMNAQEEVKDTLTILHGTDIKSEGESSVPVEGVLPSAQPLDGEETGSRALPSVFYPFQYYSNFLPGQSTLANWESGSLTAAGQTGVMPGMMNTESGEIIFRQRVGNFILDAYGAANHYGYFHGMETQWGFGGSLTYQLADNVALTAFGAYYTSTGIMQPALMGYVNYPMYGGYVNYRFKHSRFGVKLGAQSYYDPLRKAWQVQPIAMPYFHFKGGADMGIDLGGILYHLLQDSQMRKNPGNPTINPAKTNPAIGPILINR